MTPARLFHATAPGNADAITRDGIRPGFDGVVYLGTSPGVCMAFMWSRISVQVTGWEERLLPGANPADWASTANVRIDGDAVYATVPIWVENDHAVIFTIDTARLDPDLFALSEDHDPDVFGADVSWAYAGPIPPSVFVGEPRKMAPVPS